jgi:hypothetical protein
LDRVFSSLTKYWQGQGLRIAPPATEGEIEAFENKYVIQMDQQFRAYLLTVNGMLQTANDQCDSNLFAFWQLGRIRPVAEECPELQTTAEEKRCFVFADYMIWSWAYAIDFNSSSSNAGRVILVGGLREQFVASSFHEFVHLYVQDSPRLYAAPA